MALEVPALQPRTVPTMYFIGVTTAKSAMMKIFPRWSEILGIGAELVGYDAALHAPAEVYRAIVRHIKTDTLSIGALVTTHKIDLLAASRDMFDTLDHHAQICEEVSSISKLDGRLEGHALDPISSGKALEAFIEPGYWSRMDAEVLCLGAGGSATAISTYFANHPDQDRPRKFTVVDVSQDRLDKLCAMHAKLKTAMPLGYILNSDPAKNDALMASLPAGSLVINATGMGKDRPGSPITDRGQFPKHGLVWELNYRGELDFLHQAEQQATSRELRIEDGWIYFLHGWAQVVAQVFHLELTPELFDKLDKAAASARW
jgi:shikimate dehydrogenase